MKIKDYLPAGFVILLALSISVAVICQAAHEKQKTAAETETVSYQTPGQLLLESLQNEPSEPETASKNASSGGTVITRITNIEMTAENTSTENDSTEDALAGNNSATSSDDETVFTKDNTETESYAASGDDSRIYYTDEDDSRIYYTDYRFTTVDTSYFDDAVFIGNSRLQGFILYSKVPDLCAYTSVGMTVKSYFNKAVFNINGVEMTAAEALEATPGFKKVYIKLGINELGWVSTEQFIEAYGKILEHIYSCNPDAIIFINSVLPISEAAIEKDPTLSQEKITEYNEAIKDMAASYGACYLDVASIFTGEDGYMPYEYSFDGVHLNVDSVQRWLTYLLEHGIEEN